MATGIYQVLSGNSVTNSAPALERALFLSGGAATADFKAAGTSPRFMISPEFPLRILMSYHYYKDEDVAAILKDCFGNMPVQVFADSGAFSAFTGGTKIDPIDYLAWVRRWKDSFALVAGPDVIGAGEASFRETEIMREQLPNLPILHTFHVGEDWAFLRKILDTRVKYIAFGGMVPYTRQRPLLNAWLKKAWSMLPPDVSVHGFGMTTWPLVLAYPWASVDSSSWTSFARYAHLALFTSRGKWVTINMNSPTELLKHRDLLASYGLRPAQARGHNFDRDLLCGVSVDAWRRAERWLRSRGRQVDLATVPHGGAPNNPKDLSRGLAR